jgi:hypothetical protein
MRGSRVHLSGTYTFSGPVGNLCAVTTVAVPGSQPHIVASFMGIDGSSLRLELDPGMAAELTRRLPESLASIRDFPDCSGSVWGGEL